MKAGRWAVGLMGALALSGCRGSDNVTGTGAPATGTPAIAAKLAFAVQPTSAPAGVALTPAVAVTIEDSLGHQVTGATNAVTVAIDTGVSGLSGTTTVKAVNGIATFRDLSIQRARSGYFLTASSDSLTRATSALFSIAPAAPAQLIFNVQPSSAWPGQSITPAVQVAIQDVFANLVLSATSPVAIAIGTNPSGGKLSGTTTATATSGVATFANLAIDRSGSGYTLAATATGLIGGASATFNIHTTWAKLSAGAWQTCGLTSGGAAFCWGWDFYGQLGNGAQVETYTPAPVSGGLPFAMLSGGGQHTCGVTSSGVTYCWGDNEFGELGNGTTTNSSVPVAVSGGLSFAAVSSGTEYHTCGLTSAGAAYCWGNNSYGQLGTGDTTRRATPVAVSGGLTFTGLSTGSHHTCGLTLSGAAYCWGGNSSGQLGTGDTTSNKRPVRVSGGLAFDAVRTGYFHTCGLTAAGLAYCWGSNFGELGNGTTANSPAPVAVSGGLTFATLSAGDGHTCGITPAGAAYCWGNNAEGELGTGATAPSTTPVAVSRGLIFAALNAGAFHTCGVTTAGAAYCWGNDAHGQLGSPPTRRMVCYKPNPWAPGPCQWRQVVVPVVAPTPISDPPASTAAIVGQPRGSVTTRTRLPAAPVLGVGSSARDHRSR